MNNDTKSQAQEALRRWAEISRTNTEAQVLRGLLRSLIEISPATDTFSTWFLAGIGGSIALFVSNLSSLTTLFTPVGLRWTLLLLVGSIAAGFVQKSFAFLAAIQAQAARTTETLLKDALTAHEATEKQIEELAAKLQHKADTDIRFDRVLDEFEKRLPWFARWRFKRLRPKMASDPYFAETYALRTGGRQNVCLLLQMLFTLGALLCLVFSFQ